MKIESKDIIYYYDNYVKTTKELEKIWHRKIFMKWMQRS